MTTKRTSKSAAHRAAKRRKQLQPIPPPAAPKPATPAPMPAPAPMPKPAPVTPAPSPVVAPKVTPTPAPSPVAPKAPAQWKGWVVLVAVIVGIVFFAASLVNRSRQQVAQATPTAKVAAAAPTVKSTATPVATSTQAPATIAAANVPSGFCENKDAIVTHATARWPDSDPCSGKKGTYVVVKGQSAPGVYENDNKSFSSYIEATTKMLTGTLWFEPEKSQAPTNTPSIKATATPAPTATATSSHEVVLGVALGQCTTKATREERLDCATKYYFDFGQKLTGIKAYMRSLGAEWNEIKIGDPFQPSADALQSGSPRIWGAVLKATGLKATGNSCLVTDVPSRVKDFKWVFLDTRYNPKPSVGHYGEAVTIGNLIEIAFHGDCSDWSEIRQAAQAAGYTLK